jgi:hypothetical protein
MKQRLFIVGLSIAVLGGVASAGAAETTQPPGTWNIVAEARGVSPYAETPSEQSGGGPFLRAELQSDNQTVPAYAFGALGYPSYLAQEGALVKKDKPGDVNASSSPDSKYGKSARFAPFGDAGPYVAVEAPDDLTAHGDGAFRLIEPGGVKADGGFSETKSYYSAELKAMVAEARTHVMGLNLADKLRIANFESWIRMTIPLDAGPTVDYRLAMTGVTSEKSEAAGWSTRPDSYGAGNKDVVISGQGLGFGKVAADFADKMNEQSGIPNLMKGGLLIDKPRIGRKGLYYRLAGAAVELRSENAPRQNQFGQVTALRIGDAAAEGYYVSTGAAG